MFHCFTTRSLFYDVARECRALAADGQHVSRYSSPWAIKNVVSFYVLGVKAPMIGPSWSSNSALPLGLGARPSKRRPLKLGVKLGTANRPPLGHPSRRSGRNPSGSKTHEHQGVDAFAEVIGGVAHIKIRSKIFV